jgi:N-acetylglucosamine-6-phosphate deacetylase
MTRFALAPDYLYAPDDLGEGLAVLIEAGRIVDVCAVSALAPDTPVQEVSGALAPGFIDLQVNGGGGVLFNDTPNTDGLAAIAAAHRRFGTTGFLATLISDDLSVMAAAIAAVDAAMAQGLPGLLGIHLEGPFLNAAKKGVHDAAKFRTLDADAVALMSSLQRGATLVTLAPELAPPGAIAALSRAGVKVAAGHSQATYEQMAAARAEGLSGVTHLFNAMSPLESRAPGVVGAALDFADLWCGLIADGHHVHPAAMRVALRAKGAARLALVTDAMPTVGSAQNTFQLGGQTIRSQAGRLVTADGALAGADLDMAQAVRNAENLLRAPRADALAMASATPASILGMGGARGVIAPGAAGDLVLLDSDGRATQTWIAGKTS